MKKRLSHLPVLGFLLICGSLSAQTDSTYFDLGRIQLRKDFTQHVTIKARDLENIPFARITDAIAPWLQGRFSGRPNIVFIVDGNLVNSVDAWSIHDIEEITLIQNALVQVSGSARNQQLVLVKTKRNAASPKGITVAGSSYLANMDYQALDAKSENNFYHQYHVGAWKKSGKISFGASANWLRDVFPYTKNIFKIDKPRQLNRFRFNGWLNAELAEGHMLTIGLNVAPQTISSDITATYAAEQENDDIKLKSTTINPTLHLLNRIAKGLTHELDVSYFTNRSPQHTVATSVMLPPASGGYQSVNNSLFKYSNVLVRDRISYTHRMGQWELQPAIGFSYRSIRQEYNFGIVTYSNGGQQSISAGQASFKGEAWTLAPAVSLSYANAFSISGGISAKLKKDYSAYKDRVFPFVTTMVDLLRIGRPGNTSSLKIFGSFAKAGDFMDIRFEQPDLSFDPDPLNMGLPGPIFGGNITYAPYPSDAVMLNLQAGAAYSLADDRLEISYNYDNRRFIGDYLVWVGGGTGNNYVVYHPDYISSVHRVAVMTRVAGRGDFRWLSGINATGLKYKLKDLASFPGWEYSVDANDDRILWTGGFTNRLRYRQFSFGLDLLYVFNERRHFPSGYETVNAFRLNSVYAGYSFKIANGKPLEAYISTRNLWQNDKANFADNRRYYGAGFKLNL